VELDRQRIETYLDEIANESMLIKSAIDKTDEDIVQSPLLRGLKYSIILISEAIANVLQHILAKKYHVSINGYTQCFAKGRSHNIISENLYNRLKPFSSFRILRFKYCNALQLSLLSYNNLYSYKIKYVMTSVLLSTETKYCNASIIFHV